MILRLVPKDGQWHVSQDNQAAQIFATQEGALAYAVSYASEAEVHVFDEHGQTVKIFGVQRDR